MLNEDRKPPFYCLCPKGFTGLLCNETEHGTCPGPCLLLPTSSPAAAQAAGLACPAVGNGPQHPSRCSLPFSWKLPGHLESWVLPSLGLTHLHVTLLGSRLAQAPSGRLRGVREELGGTGRQWAEFGWRVLWGLACLSLPVSSSFLTTCPSYLLPPQVPVPQTPATMMLSARKLTTASEGMSSPSTSAGALLDSWAPTVRAVSIQGCLLRGAHPVPQAWWLRPHAGLPCASGSPPGGFGAGQSSVTLDWGGRERLCPSPGFFLPGSLSWDCWPGLMSLQGSEGWG